MKNGWKRFLSILIVVFMLIGCLPVSAMAEIAEEEQQTEIETEAVPEPVVQEEPAAQAESEPEALPEVSQEEPAETPDETPLPASPQEGEPGNEAPAEAVDEGGAEPAEEASAELPEPAEPETPETPVPEAPAEEQQAEEPVEPGIPETEPEIAPEEVLEPIEAADGEARTLYSITLVSRGHGTIEADRTEAAEGDLVSLTENSSYPYHSLTVMDENGWEIPVQDLQFVMPAANVTVTAVFPYLVTCTSNEFGTITPGTMDPGYFVPSMDGVFAQGDTVVLSAASHDGYALLEMSGWTVHPLGNDLYSFEMPNMDVEISAVFSETRSITLLNGLDESVYGVFSAYCFDYGEEYYALDLNAVPQGRRVQLRLSTPGMQFASADVQMRRELPAGGEEWVQVDGAFFSNGGPWPVIIFNMPAGDVTVDAELESAGTLYSVTVETTGGGTVVPSAENAVEGQVVTLTVEPEDGYALSSLTAAGPEGDVHIYGGGGGSNLYAFDMPAGDVTVYAIFIDANSYIITFNACGGYFYGNPSTTVTTETVSIGTALGYDIWIEHANDRMLFDGWYRNAEYTGDPVDLETFTSEENVTLYAKWKEGYLVTFDANGGHFGDGPEDTQQTVVIAPGNAVNESPYVCYEDDHMVHAGWYLNAACTGNAVDPWNYVPEDDVTLYAKWVQGYKVTFDANGGHFGNGPQDTQRTYVIVPGRVVNTNPTVYHDDDHMINAGWYLNAAGTGTAVDPWNYVPEGDVTLYAKMVRGYVVTFDANGGHFWEGPEHLQETYVIVPGSAVNENPTVHHENDHTINAGWYLNAEGTGTAVNVWEYVPEGDVTLYAKWVQGYSVTFEACGGYFNGDPDAEEITHLVVPGNAVNYSPWISHSNDHMVFDGWYLNAAYTGGEISEWSFIPEGDCTLYAKWVPGYVITFDGNGGFIGEDPSITTTTYTIIPGSKIDYSPIAINPNPRYQRSGWYYDRNCVEEVILSEFVPTDDCTLYAGWAWANIVTLNANGGYFYSNTSYTEMPLYVIEGCAIRMEMGRDAYHSNSNMVLEGWCTDEACENLVVNEDRYYIPSEDCTLYAKWVEGIVLTFDANGGCFNEDPSQTQYSVTILPGSSINNYPLPYNSNDHLILRGWYLDRECSGDPLDLGEFFPEESCTLYAGWLYCNKVTFDANGGYFWQPGVTQDSYLIPPRSTISRNPTVSHMNDHMAMEGWYLDPECSGARINVSTYMPYEDITLYAHWVPGYRVTFDANGGYFWENPRDTVWTITIVPGRTADTDTTVYYSNPQMVFAGWYLDQACTGSEIDPWRYVPEGDVTYYAKQVIGCTVTFDPCGGHFWGDPDQTEYSILTAPGRPLNYYPSVNHDNDHYILDGWYQDPGYTGSEVDFDNFRPDGDCTLYARWIRGYVVTFDAHGGYFNGDPTKTTLDSGAIYPGTAISGYYYNPQHTDPAMMVQGWYLDPECTQLAMTQYGAFTPTEDTTLYAKWVRACIITLNAGDGVFSNGSSTMTVQVQPGNYFYAGNYSPMMDDLHMVVEGWYNDADFSELIVSYYGSFIPEGDMTLYAKWGTASVVTFDANGGYFDYPGAVTTAIQVRPGYGVDGESAVPVMDDDHMVVTGWYLDPACTHLAMKYDGYFEPTEDITLYAAWGRGYIVTLDANGGYFWGDPEETSAVSDVIRPGKTFYTGSQSTPRMSDSHMYVEGWYLDPACTQLAAEYNGYYAGTDDVTLYANWESGFVITLDANGGYWYDPEDEHLITGPYRPGEKFYADSETPATDEPGMLVEGWYKDPGCTQLVVKHGESFVPTEDMTLYAKWEQGYYLTVDANGGYFYSGWGQDVTRTRLGPFRPGDTFRTEQLMPYRNDDPTLVVIAWCEDAAGNLPVVTAGGILTVTEDMTLYAKWDHGCTLTLDANGGCFSGDESQTQVTVSVAPGSVSHYWAFLRHLQNDHMIFRNTWNTEPDGSGESFYLEDYVITEDVTLYAEWTECYFLTLHANGGYFEYDPDIDEYSLQVEVGDMVDPTYASQVSHLDSHMAVEGWYYDEDLTQFACKGNESFFPDHDCTLYAKWAEGYVITLDGNGGYFRGNRDMTQYKARVVCGEALGNTPSPQIDQEHMEYFGEWYTTPECTGETIDLYDSYVPTGDITLYAKWELAYRVKLVLNHGASTMNGQDSITYYVYAGDPMWPTREAAVRYADPDTGIEGWYFDEELTDLAVTGSGTLTVDRDMTLYAKWAPLPVQMTVTLDRDSYDYADRVYASVSVTDLDGTTAGLNGEYEDTEIYVDLYNENYWNYGSRSMTGFEGELIFPLIDETMRAGTYVVTAVKDYGDFVLHAEKEFTFTAYVGELPDPETCSIEIEVDQEEIHNGDTIHITAHVTDSEGDPVKGMKVWMNTLLCDANGEPIDDDYWLYHATNAEGTCTLTLHYTESEAIPMGTYMAIVRIDGTEISDSKSFLFLGEAHPWGEPTYTWTNDNNTLTATVVCEDDSSHTRTESVETTFTVLTPAGCETEGAGRFRGAFINPLFEPQTKDVTIPATGHAWQGTTYTWTDDHSHATATRSCEYDSRHVQTETVGSDYAVTVPAGCETTGTGVYTAEFSNTAFETQTYYVSLPATGHAWGEVQYSWTVDNSKVTAWRTCGNNASHIETETVDTVLTVTTAPTYDSTGEGYYTATFTNPAFAEQTKTVEIPKLVHETVAEGVCGAQGDNLIWTLDDAGVLRISGSGAMMDFGSASAVPWAAYTGSIQSVMILSGATSIGSWAFNGCSNLSGISIPNGVTSIGGWAFGGCSGLMSLGLPTGLMGIGDHAFDGCSGLSGLTIPSGVTSIGGYAFGGCSGLMSLSLPGGLLGIGSGAFFGCSGLTGLAIPSGVTSIGGSAFSGCSGLETLSIPSSVTSIGEQAFTDCGSLTDINFDGTVVQWANLQVGSFGGATTIHCGDPEGSSQVDATEIGLCGSNSVWYLTDEGILTISGSGAMENYASASEVPWASCTGSVLGLELGAEITTIGSMAFANCSSLASVTVPKTITSIGASAFSGCNGLNSITFIGSAMTISGSAFTGVEASAYYPRNNPTWTEAVFQNYGGELTWLSYELYSEPVWTWNEDNTAATATSTCSFDGQQVTKDAVISTSTRDATCEEAGETTITATATFEGVVFTDDVKIPIPAKGHNWGTVQYSWTDDNSHATATRTCSRDSSHVETETVISSYEVTTDPGCETAGAGLYTATFTNAAFAAQTKEVPIAATGHAWGEPDYSWASDNSTVTASRVCGNDSSHVETETKNTEYTVTLEPTETTTGTGLYTATFTNPAFTEQTKEVTIPKIGTPVPPTISNYLDNWSEETANVTAGDSIDFSVNVTSDSAITEVTAQLWRSTYTNIAVYVEVETMATITMTDQGNGLFTGSYTFSTSDFNGGHYYIGYITATDADGDVTEQYIRPDDQKDHFYELSGCTVDDQGPTVTSFEMAEAGQDMHVGDTVHLTASFDDESGIHTIWGGFASSVYFSATADRQDARMVRQVWLNGSGEGPYTGEFTFSESNHNGYYYIVLTPVDYCGNRSSIETDGQVCLTNGIADNQGPEITELVLPENGTHVAANQTIQFSAKAVDGSEVREVIVSLFYEGPEEVDVFDWPRSITLTKGTNDVYTGSYTFSAGDPDGLYTVEYVYAEDIYDNPTRIDQDIVLKKNIYEITKVMTGEGAGVPNERYHKAGDAVIYYLDAGGGSPFRINESSIRIVRCSDETEVPFERVYDPHISDSDRHLYSFTMPADDVIFYVTYIDTRTLTINKETLSLYVNQTDTLQVTDGNGNAAEVTWESTNPAIATVTAEGLVKALKSGKTNIRALDAQGNEIAVCAVTVVFTDVADSSRYFYEPVYWALDNGITTGAGGAGLFSPNNDCTREQIVTFLWRLMGEPEPTVYTSFTDVPENAWYYKPICWAAEKGITVGLNDGTGRFGVGQACTRAMCVTFLWRAAGKPAPATQGNFTDMKPGAYYVDAVSWAAENGITVGLNDGTGRFGINNSCTRAMIVTFLYRFAHMG